MQPESGLEMSRSHLLQWIDAPLFNVMPGPAARALPPIFLGHGTQQEIVGKTHHPKGSHVGKQLRNLLKLTKLRSVFSQAEDDGITIA
jgi:hypothetical protein